MKVAGNPAVDGSPELNATNMLLPDGRELSLGFGGSPRFAGRMLGDGSAWMVAKGDGTRPELGLFRVWSSTFAGAAILFDDPARPTPLDYPLTPEARRAVQTFDSVEGSRRLANDCTPKGMPWIMEQPYDIAFERSGNDIVLKLEEFDVARRVRMDWTGDRAAQPFTLHGFSTGEWQDRTLVVTTTNLNSPNFKFEIPASDEASIVERFTPTVGGDRLDYEIVVTDPAPSRSPFASANFGSRFLVRRSTRTTAGRRWHGSGALGELIKECRGRRPRCGPSPRARLAEIFHALVAELAKPREQVGACHALEGQRLLDDLAVADQRPRLAAQQMAHSRPARASPCVRQV